MLLLAMPCHDSLGEDLVAPANADGVNVGVAHDNDCLNDFRMTMLALLTAHRKHCQSGASLLLKVYLVQDTLCCHLLRTQHMSYMLLGARNVIPVVKRQYICNFQSYNYRIVRRSSRWT